MWYLYLTDNEENDENGKKSKKKKRKHREIEGDVFLLHNYNSVLLYSLNLHNCGRSFS